MLPVGGLLQLGNERDEFLRAVWEGGAISRLQGHVRATHEPSRSWTTVGRQAGPKRLSRFSRSPFLARLPPISRPRNQARTFCKRGVEGEV